MKKDFLKIKDKKDPLNSLKNAYEMTQSLTNKSLAFNTLRDRVKERGIILNKYGYPKSHVWTTYRRLYEDTNIFFSIVDVKEGNIAIVEVLEGDYKENIEVQLFFRKREAEWEKILKDSGLGNNEFIDLMKDNKEFQNEKYLDYYTDFELTDDMKNGIKKFGIDIVS